MLMWKSASISWYCELFQICNLIQFFLSALIFELHGQWLVRLTGNSNSMLTSTNRPMAYSAHDIIVAHVISGMHKRTN